jgi:YebC/PmpR family DNA-binding regulatory protein
MSGHSKWATIRRAKGATDAKRGALFTRLGREVMVAAKEGGGNPDSNIRLRLAIEKARAGNMPKDNIQRAIDRATGVGADGVVYEEITYEGYLPHKVPALIHVMTDNKNRTAADVRKILTRSGGALGEGASVAWQFERKGYLVIERTDKVDPDAVFELAAEAGADDIQTSDEVVEIYTSVDSFRTVRDALTANGYTLASAEVSMIPTTQTSLNKEETEKVLEIIDALEEMDDVQDVYHNLEVSEEVAA